MLPDVWLWHYRRRTPLVGPQGFHGKMAPPSRPNAVEHHGFPGTVNLRCNLPL